MSASLSIACLEPKVFAPGDNVLFGFDMSGAFPAGGLTGTPSVSCYLASQTGYDSAATGTVTTGDITIDAPVVNSSSYVDDHGKTVGIGFAVQARIHGSSVDGGNYDLKITASDGVNTRTVTALLQCRLTPPS